MWGQPLLGGAAPSVRILVEPGHRLQWRAHERQKHLEGSRLVEPTGPGSCRFTEVVEGRLLGPSRSLEPLVAWLLQRQAIAPA